MDDANKAKILDRIQKLIALSTSPNENEAAVAAEKAQALLIEHNLSMADVKAPTPGKTMKADIHSFVGEPHNAAVATMMFQYLDKAVNDLAVAGAKRISSTTEQSKYRTTFRNAAVNQLCKRIMQRIEAARRGEVKSEAGTNLPALASLYDTTAIALADQLKIMIPGGLKTKTQKVAILHGDGYAEGTEAGRRIGLDQQVSGRGSRTMIGNK
jgi:putative NIF3 family GTP cyclohydrolase 1 type 2